MLVVSLGLIYLALLWQDDYSLMAWGDALFLAFTLELFIGWILFVYNKNLFSPLIHAYKSFFLMFVGKKPKLDYFHYSKNISENPIPVYYYIVIFISAFVLLIPTLITFFIII